ncbi:MAG: gliding motility-associated C-terminal domain-containing protein [Bacteroidia bacterium]
MKLLHIFFIWIWALSSTATAQNWIWSQSFGNIKSDKATAIRTDSLGYIFVAGYFSTSVSLGNNGYQLNFTSNQQSKEVFLAKFDSTGNCLWARSGGQYWDDRVLGLAVDKDGNSVITGTYWEGSGINIGGNVITGNSFGWGDQCFIAKHDPNGNYLWGNFVCSEAGDDQGLDVAMDYLGNVYVAGFMSGNTLYCGGATVTASGVGTGSYDCSYYLAKFDPNGQAEWARTFGNLPWDTLHNKYLERDIAVTTDYSGVYVAGGYDHTRPFGNTTLTSNGGYDIFVLKYDLDGGFEWARGGGSDKDDWCNGICTDHRGNVYITGEHRDSLFIDTVIIKNYDKRDAYVIKLETKTGHALWGKRAGSNLGDERGNDVYADRNCNVYVCGDIQGGAKFGDSLLVPLGNEVQAFVARISTKGNWKWFVTGGGPDDNDRANSVTKGLGNQIYTAGFFRSPATFGNTTHSSIGSSDAFIARVYDSLYKTACEPAIFTSNTAYTNPLQDFYVPNAFTPNQDGYNDYLNISTAELRQVEVKIFNRLGEVVYQSNTTNGKGWDGTHQGRACMEGVYYYQISATQMNGKQGVVQGTITLFR